MRFYKDHTSCHLCELPIPPDIVTEGHPLFGTIDHLEPLSLGGRDIVSNRLPAHRGCNCFRGNKPITAEIKAACLDKAVRAFQHWGIDLSRRGAKYSRVVRLIKQRQKAKAVAQCA